MKKVLLVLIVISSSSFVETKAPEPKNLKVEATLSEWDKHYSKLQAIRNIVDNSNLSNQEVKFITKSIDSLSMLIVPQLQKQISDTTKK